MMCFVDNGLEWVETMLQIFASGAAALAYISGLDIAVGNGDIIDYGAPTYHLKRNVEGNPRQGAFLL